MRNTKSYLLIILLVMVFNLNCKSQDEDKNNQQIDRQPYAAGRFYSDNPSELRTNLEALFTNAVPRNERPRNIFLFPDYFVALLPDIGIAFYLLK